VITPSPRRTPLGIQLIVLFYMFGAVVLLAGLLMNPAGVGTAIATAHGLSPIIGAGLVPVVAVLALVMGYGLYTGSRWGFYLALVYMVYVGAAGLVQGGLNLWRSSEPVNPVFFGNVVWSAVVIIYLLIARRHYLDPH
jgi:hypothetical protein